jgi:hypothetical protein
MEKNGGTREEIFGCINKCTWTLLSRTMQCNLYFTSNRVIVAMLGKEDSLIWWGLGGLIGGFIGGAVAAEKVKRRFEEYKNLSSESILKADIKNFAIPYAEVTKIETKKYRYGLPTINIFTPSKKYEFRFVEKFSSLGSSENIVRDASQIEEACQQFERNVILQREKLGEQKSVTAECKKI